MINNHNCDNASPPWNNAGAMLRAGFTEVPVIGIHTICTNTRDKPIASPAKLPALLSGLLHAQHFGLDVLSGQAEGGLDDLAGISLGLIEGSLLHNAGTHGGHLGTEVISARAVLRAV